jgi:hypothetical protein
MPMTIASAKPEGTFAALRAELIGNATRAPTEASNATIVIAASGRIGLLVPMGHPSLAAGGGTPTAVSHGICKYEGAQAVRLGDR